jgi:LPXTG-motif cell wall-anchored protein
MGEIIVSITAARRRSLRSRLSLLLRSVLAAALVLIAIPLLTPSSAFAADDPDGTTLTTSDSSASEPVTPPPGTTTSDVSPDAAPSSADTTPTGEGTGGAEDGSAGTDTSPTDTGGGTDKKDSRDAKVADPTTTTTSSTRLIDGALTVLDPACKVNDFLQNTLESTLGSWVPGNLNAQQTDYAEGDLVPQKVELGGLVPGNYALKFRFVRRIANSVAYDYVSNLDILGSSAATATWSSTNGDFAGPANTVDPTVDTVTVTIRFTINAANDPTATLRWDGHIGAALDYYPLTGAGGINGSPYHFNLIATNADGSLFGCATGAMANQLQASAVDAARITIVKDALPNSAQDFNFQVAAPNGLAAAPVLDDDAGATGEDSDNSSSISYPVPPGTVTISEDVTAGWDLTGLVCLKSGSPIGTRTGTSVALSLVDNDNVTCTFTNSRTSSLVVDKQWIINGGSPIAEGSEPTHLGLSATLLLDGTPRTFGQSYPDYLQGTQVAIDESASVGVDNALCRWADPARPYGTLDESGGAPVAHTVTLTGGANHYTLTNRVTCESGLTLVKSVLNGPASADAWTLSAAPADAGRTFASGPSGVNHSITGNAAYILDEDSADSRYEQFADWVCTDFGSVTTVDGHQRVTVATGRTATCTVKNATGVLVLQKLVPNKAGGSAVPGDFTLVATPTSGAALTTPGSATGTTFYVNPATTFALTETGGPQGYGLSSLTCDNSADPAALQVPANTTVTCTYVNTEVPGSLSLQKTVAHNGTGDTSTADEWTLTAAPVDIAGQPTITGNGVAAGGTRTGTYQLSESGPSDHIPGTWTCSDTAGDTVTVNASNQIHVGLDEHVTCLITNTAIQPTLTLVKEVEPGTTGDDTAPTRFTLTATPSDKILDQATLSGPGGASSAVRVGTYTLSETGPVSYRAGDTGWQCVDDKEDVVAVDGDKVTIDLAMDVTCTIENVAIPSSWTVSKSSDVASGSTVLPGQEINYILTLAKVGTGVSVHGIVVTDTLTGVPDSWVGDLPAGATLSDGVITWNAPTLSDTELTLSYTVTVGEVWNATIENHVTPGPVACEDTHGVECDETVHHTPHFTLDKVVEHLANPGDGDDLVEPGERLEYTLTVHNDTEHAFTDAIITDDASNVFDDAVMITAAPELADQGLIFDATDGAESLTWTVEDLAPGATATATYVVQVAAGAWGASLDNVAAPGTGGDCVAAKACETVTPTPAVTTMVVEKRDTETDEVLAGATFELFLDANNARGEDGSCTHAAKPVVDDEDSSLGLATTPANGQVQFPDLQPGCYLLVERTAPAGYDLPAHPVMGVEVNEENFIAGGLMSPLVVTDFAQGDITITKRQYELVNDAWVESDGVVSFGDQVKYVLSVAATGPKNFHDVLVTDYVPGFNLADVTSTLKGAIVPGSAVCGAGLPCETTVLADQLVVFDFGDIEPAEGQTLHGSAEMVVTVPKVTDEQAPKPGITFTGSMWNVGFLTWSDITALTDVADITSLRLPVGRRALADLPLAIHELRTNEVGLRASVTAPPVAPAVHNPTQPVKTSSGSLPQTGAPAGMFPVGLLGILLVTAGAVLARRRRIE